MSVELIKNRISKLSIKERQELIKYIKNSYSVFDDYNKVSCCSFCQSKRIVKNGTRNNVQKFLCKDCKKYFTYKTGTILSGIHNEQLTKWNSFVEDFMSLNLTPIEELKTKLEVSTQTIFNWRHKLLSSLSSSDLKFKNEEVEFDETFFLISRKGRQDLNITNKSSYRYWRKSQVGDTNYNVKVFFTYGRNSKQLELHQSHMGRTSSTDLEKYFLPSKFEDVSVYSDSHRSYGNFFKNTQYTHEIFMSKDHVNLKDNNIHNQTINSYMRGFKDFVNRDLRGVSTKYLNYYCKWYQFIHEVKNIVKKELKENRKLKFNIVDKICQEVVSDNNGLELYRQTENSFIWFLEQNDRTNFGECKNHYYQMTG